MPHVRVVVYLGEGPNFVAKLSLRTTVWIVENRQHNI